MSGKIMGQPKRVRLVVELEDGSEWELDFRAAPTEESKIKADIDIDWGVRDVTNFEVDTWMHREPTGLARVEIKIGATDVKLEGKRTAATANEPA
jgi:hypothetical protein